MAEPAQEPTEVTQKSSSSFLHPAAGGLILGADWLLFGGTVSTGGLAMPVTATLGFLVGSIGTTLTQRFLAEEGWGKSIAKGFLAGLAVGAPMPIGGTVVGGAVLASSGLNQLRDRAAQAVLEGPKKKDRPAD
jgi:hypothetical protein